MASTVNPTDSVAVQCDVAGSKATLIVQRQSPSSSSSTNPRILSAHPPLNKIPFATATQDVPLVGTDLDQLPRRMLVGPYVVEVVPVNSSFATARVPASSTCQQLLEQRSFTASQRDYVFASQYATSPGFQSENAALCAGKANADFVPINLFAWDGLNDHNKCPQLVLSLALDLDLGIAGSSLGAVSNSTMHLRHQQVQQAPTPSVFFLEAGAPPVNATAVFRAVDAETGIDLPATRLEEIPTSTEASFDALFLHQLPAMEKNKTAVVVHSLSAQDHQIAPLTLHLRRSFGPREYDFAVLIPVSHPRLEASLVAVSGKRATLFFNLSSVAGSARAVSVHLYAEAQVTVGLSTRRHMKSCVRHFPGLMCSFGAMSPSEPIEVELDLEYPGYYRSDITVHYSCAASNVLDPLSGYLYLPSASSTDHSVSDSAHGSAAQSLGTTDDMATEAPGRVPQAALRSIFGSSSSKALLCTNPLFYTIVAFGAALIYVLVVRVIRNKQASTAPICTYEGVPLWRSLLLQHAWFSLFLPCHSRCAITHAVLPFTHTLTLLLLATAITSMISAGQSGAVWLVAGVSTLLAQPVRPLLQYYYYAWKFDTDRYERELRERQEARLQENATRMKEALRGKQLGAGQQQKLAPSTAVLGNIEFVDDDDASDFSPQEAAANECASITDVEVRGIEELAIRSEGALDDLCELPTKQLAGDSRVIDEAAQSSGLEQMEEEEGTEGEVVSAAAVVVDKFVNRGHIVNAVYALLSVGITLTLMTQQLTAPDTCILLLDSFGYAVLLDVLATQTIVVGLVYGYRWMTSSKIDDEENDCLWSELHPLDGEERPYRYIHG